MRIKPVRLAARRRCMLVLAGLAVLVQVPAVSADHSTDEALWSALESGGFVILLRHAVTEPGIGDPPGCRLGDCSTQRNLSAQGRKDAQHIGAVFHERGIPVQEVHTVQPLVLLHGDSPARLRSRKTSRCRISIATSTPAVC